MEAIAIASITRYAPSPTGHVHMGHVAHMLYVWGAARAYEADVLLRMEDHDRSRCRPEFERTILEDLDWLGFSAVNSIDASSRYRQSDSAVRYEDALQLLKQNGLVYACTCTRRQLAARIDPDDSGERRYDGYCRGAEHGWTDAALRVQLSPGTESFVDRLCGEQRQDPSQQCGDLVLRDRTGQWTYQLSVVVDDIAHGVDLVVRGEDLLASTGRQIRLARLLGRRSISQFLHHPLILDHDGTKLSKKTAAGPVRDLRAAGQSVDEVLGLAAYHVGLTTELRPLGLDEALDAVALRIRNGAEYVAR